MVQHGKHTGSEHETKESNFEERKQASRVSHARTLLRKMVDGRNSFESLYQKVENLLDSGEGLVRREERLPEFHVLPGV